MLDALELRLQRPPYSLVLLCFDVPADQKVSVVEDMRNTPQDCLPLFGQRLCSLCPTHAMMLDAGAKIVEAWASTSFATIDESERARMGRAMQFPRASGGGNDAASSSTA